MGDARIGHHASEIVLSHRKDVAYAHRQRRAHQQDWNDDTTCTWTERSCSEQSNQSNKPSHLGQITHHAGHRHAGPLENVGSVKMKRHGGDPERQSADRQEQPQGHQSLPFTERSLDNRQVGRATKPEQVAHTQEEKARGKGAQEKVLQGRFGSCIVVSDNSKEDIGREAYELETQEHRHQIVRCTDDGNGSQDDQQASVVLGEASFRSRRPRHQNEDQAPQKGKPFCGQG